MGKAKRVLKRIWNRLQRLNQYPVNIKIGSFYMTIHNPNDRPKWIGPVDKFIVEHFKTQ
jgi:hypothetical protein